VMLFGFVIHPFVLLDAGSISSHQVRHQFLNLGFCFWRKILGRKELPHSETHCAECPEAITHTEVTTADRGNGAFPSGLLFLLTGERFAAQLKVGTRKSLR